MSSSEFSDQAVIADRVAAARSDLEARMVALGLTHAKGWEILERVVDARRRCKWIFLAVHTKGESPPDGLSVEVSIDGDGKVGE